ncbi:hypothetical protein I553_4621 [Mycobacterium xenopi 4042]|uniref:Ferredoxin n=1 Tax=Mycobacterium xenopi 4042 TaxID=1299334 RepID=X8AFQ6_MYCXE|nr:hypothetical protein I553_4621 [Mycobacterium xenopi 4042]
MHFALIGPTKWNRYERTHDHPPRPHHLRRFRHLRQACAEVFFTRRLGICVPDRDGTVLEEDRDAVMRALLDCPVHAIMEIGEHRPHDTRPPSSTPEDPAASLKTEENEAEWGSRVDRSPTAAAHA